MVVCPNLLSLGVHVGLSPTSTSSPMHQTSLLPLCHGRLFCQIWSLRFRSWLHCVDSHMVGWLKVSILDLSFLPSPSYDFFFVVIETVNIMNENMSLHWQRSPFCNISGVPSHSTWVCVSSLSLVIQGALAHFMSLSPCWKIARLVGVTWEPFWMV